MPIPRTVLNAFTSSEVARITGLSRHMVDYLALEGYLVPSYDRSPTRGSVRYYSYRDLMVGRMIRRLRDGGLELKRLKKGIAALARLPAWTEGDPKRLVALLATDGASLMLVEDDGVALDLTCGGQRAFAFVLDVGAVRDEVIAALPASRRMAFTMENTPLVFAEPRVAGRRPS